jgi:hypothetical protein
MRIAEIVTETNVKTSESRFKPFRTLAFSDNLNPSTETTGGQVRRDRDERQTDRSARSTLRARIEGPSYKN